MCCCAHCMDLNEDNEITCWMPWFHWSSPLTACMCLPLQHKCRCLHELDSLMTAEAQAVTRAYLHMWRRLLIQNVIIVASCTFVYVLNHSIIINFSLQDSTKQDCLAHAHNCAFRPSKKNKLMGDADFQDLVLPSMELTIDSLTGIMVFANCASAHLTVLRHILLKNLITCKIQQSLNLADISLSADAHTLTQAERPTVVHGHIHRCLQAPPITR